MKRVYAAVFILLAITACRKDNSAFVSSAGGDKNLKCLYLSSGSDAENHITVKYGLDSILTEFISVIDGQEDEAWYVEIENPRQLLFMNRVRSLENAKSRIYLNTDGTIAKEVKVTLNSDGITLTEDPTQADIFTYNAKKQLIKVDIHLDDEGVINLTYDDKNRIQRIHAYDSNGDDAYVYQDFTFNTQYKNDNTLAIYLFASPASFFIPSLRNVYVKSYKMTIPSMPMFDSEYRYGYKFTQGALSQVTTTVSTFGFSIPSTDTYTLSCK